MENNKTDSKQDQPRGKAPNNKVRNIKPMPTTMKPKAVVEIKTCEVVNVLERKILDEAIELCCYRSMSISKLQGLVSQYLELKK